MLQSMDELKKQILQKNLVLNSLENGSGIKNEHLRTTQVELEKLLYKYYKMLCNNEIIK